MRVFSQATPNPSALKFITEKTLKEEGKVNIETPEECLTVPLLQALFKVEGVRQLYVFENTLTVTLAPGHTWDDAKEQECEKLLSELAPVHDSRFEIVSAKPSRPKLSGALKEIDAILERTIRPGLQSDGGDLQILSLEGKVLTVYYEGACNACPSALGGTLMAIQSILQDEFDPELEVVSA